LYYGSKRLLRPVGSRGWVDAYNDVLGQRFRANKRANDYGREEAEIDAKIGNLPDVDIRQLRAIRDQYGRQAREQHAKSASLRTRLHQKSQRVKELEQKQESLLSLDQKGMKIAAELQVARDLEQLLTKALENMRTRELNRVSARMNTLFLDMIGSDPSANAIIQRAEITPEFRIVVFGPHEQLLDPSHDLNGASRRALTIAFILALAEVSEVEAPNVIDTPLGMMTGYVKQRVLQIALRHSAQLVLMLTHSEIHECEEILDRRAGKIYTLTNPAHYPKILVNDPRVDKSMILVCDCDHRSHCQVCERRESPEIAEGGAIGE